MMLEVKTKTAALFVLPALLIACGDPPVPAALVNHDLWGVVTVRDDPFFAIEAPAEYSCEPMFYHSAPFGTEPAFNIDTSIDCRYLTVKQTTLVAVEKDDPMHARIWHFPLTAPDGAAEGHVAIMINDRVAFEDRIPLPASSMLYAAYWTSDQDYAAGTPIYFHVHNHGQNSWALLEITKNKEMPKAD